MSQANTAHKRAHAQAAHQAIVNAAVEAMRQVAIAENVGPNIGQRLYVASTMITALPPNFDLTYLDAGRPISPIYAKVALTIAAKEDGPLMEVIETGYQVSVEFHIEDGGDIEVFKFRRNIDGETAGGWVGSLQAMDTLSPWLMALFSHLPSMVSLGKVELK